MQLRLSGHPQSQGVGLLKLLHCTRLDSKKDTTWEIGIQHKSGHPDIGKSVSCSPAASVLLGANTSSSPDVLGDILVYPNPSQKSTFRKRKPALNSQTVCITEESVLEQLKAEEEEKKFKEAEKEKRKLDSEQKRKAAQEQKAKKEEEKAKKAEEKAKKFAEGKQSKQGRKVKRVEEVDTITRNL